MNTCPDNILPGSEVNIKQTLRETINIVDDYNTDNQLKTEEKEQEQSKNDPYLICGGKENVDSIVCKICYEPETEDNPIFTPCKCQGSMKYIHLECLKRWYGDKDISVEKPFCEICKYEYRLLYDFEYVYSQKKTTNMLKNMLLVVIVSLIVLVLLDVLIMVIIGSVASIPQDEKDLVLKIIIGISFGILIIILLSYLRDFRDNYFDQITVNWRVKNYEEGDENVVEENPINQIQQSSYSSFNSGTSDAEIRRNISNNEEHSEIE